MDPAPFLRGNAFPGTRRVPYPRARADDASRLPLDTWAMAQIPAGVRLEFVARGDVTIDYQTRTDDLGFRGDGAGRTFQLWQRGQCVSEEKAVLGEGRAELAVPKTGTRAIVYPPEGMKPLITAVGGDVSPAPPAPRWICYGDSIAEGWCASAPALSWPAIVARTHSLDFVNMGYAGAARGEIVSAEHIASLPADVISISYGTNCWTRIPHSPEMMRATLHAFIDVVRRGHPATPIVVSSPTLRTDAETAPNALGATLGDLREAIEDAARFRSDITLVQGFKLIGPSHLADEIHPNDEGHARIAGALGPVIAGMVR